MSVCVKMRVRSLVAERTTCEFRGNLPTWVFRVRKVKMRASVRNDRHRRKFASATPLSSSMNGFAFGSGDVERARDMRLALFFLQVCAFARGDGRQAAPACSGCIERTLLDACWVQAELVVKQFVQCRLLVCARAKRPSILFRNRDDRRSLQAI